jgi:xanthine dehydrogenase accessory factor
MSGDLDEVLAQAGAWRAAGRDVALATVVRTWGSSPRPAGSQLVVGDTGEFRGSVSGGCIEGAVVKEAQGVLGAGAGSHKLLHYGVTNEMAWEVGLACGGQVDVFVERADPAVLAGLARARADKQPVVLATWLEGGEHALLVPGADAKDLDGPARRALVRDQAEVVETARGPAFLLPVNPPLRLVIVGAVHIAQPLSRLAAVAGFDVTVVDPRTAFELPGATRMTDWPDVALERLHPDRRTAIVTLTHDPKLDDPALAAALRSDAFYVGCLGSGKTHASRLRRLGEDGFSPEALARLRGPVGLRIGARTPAEIAVSILAQIIETLRAEPQPA